MATPLWLDSLRRECLSRHLPPLYVERLVCELSEHLNDIMEDRMGMDATELHPPSSALGAPREIAAAAVHEYRRRRFSSRHPWLTFVALPIATLPLLWAVSVLGLIGVIFAAKAAGFDGRTPSASPETTNWLNSVLPLVVTFIVLAPIAAAAAFYCRLAAKSALSWKWTLATSAIVALVGSMATLQIGLPSGAGKGYLSIGLSVSQHPTALQCVQFLVPLSIGAWAIYRQMNREQKSLAGI